MSAANAGSDSQLPVIPREPGLRAHVYRVAALVSRSANAIGYSAAQVGVMEAAALLHHRGIDSSADADVQRMLTDLGFNPTWDFSSLPPEVAEILLAHRGAGARSAFSTAAAALLESANFFDEQMENLPYEDVSVQQAIANLLASGVVCPEFESALASFRRLRTADLSEVVESLPAFPFTDAEAHTVSPLSEAKRIANAAVQPYFPAGEADSLWLHALEIGGLASRISSEIGDDPAEAYLAGLVHDIGRVALERSPVIGEIRRWTESGFPVVYAETMVSGADHALIGADILQSWRFPEAIVDAVRCHHRPELSTGRLSAVLYLAEDAEESLPSLARDHLVARRLEPERTRPLRRAAG